MAAVCWVTATLLGLVVGLVSFIAFVVQYAVRAVAVAVGVLVQGIAIHLPHGAGHAA